MPGEPHLPDDLSGFDDDRLNILIANFQRLRATGSAAFRKLLWEHNRRHGGDMDIDKTIEFIRERAKEGRFVSYAEVAGLYGKDWQKARRRMPAHLWDVVQEACSKSLPMLSAVIVNQQHVQTGKMEPETLQGFIKAAEKLDLDVSGDPEAFLREQQRQCFAWAGHEAA